MKRVLPPVALLLALCAFPASAILDTNSNSLSDLWEMAYNGGEPFPSMNLLADDDGDGWTNDPNPPGGFLRPEIVHIPAVWIDTDLDEIPDTISTPEAITITWPTIAGKQYTLLYSPDLAEWLPVPQETFIGIGDLVEYGITLTENDKLFWRVKVEDVDSDDDGLTNAEEAELGTDPNNPHTLTGYDDLWLATNFTDLLLNGQLVDIDTDGDGLTNAQEAILSTDPKVSDNPGILQEAIRNGDFSEPEIGSGIRSNNLNTTWDYWEGLPTQKRSWTAVGGTNIEYQKIEPIDTNNPYVELKANPTGHNGIKQKVGTRIGATYLLIFDCKARQDTQTPDLNNFSVKVDGLTIKNIIFDSFGAWSTKSVSFKASKVLTEISLVPESEPNDTMGCLVDNVKVFPIKIVFVEPDDDTWLQEMPEREVILDTKYLRFKVVINNLQESSQSKLVEMGLHHLHFTTTATRPLLYTRMNLFGPSTEIHAEENLTEIRIKLSREALKQMDLVPQSDNDDVADERSALDNVEDRRSNFSDSEAFIYAGSSWQEKYRGYSRNEDNASLNNNPFKSKLDIQSAGAEMLDVKIEGLSVEGKAMLMNQADVFYYSGHGYSQQGNYVTNEFYPGLGALEADDQNGGIVIPSDLTPYWSKDLDCAVFAGCAVLNINNWVPFPEYFPPLSGPAAGYWPGKVMENVGPPFLVGYSSKAPRDDTQGSAAIAASFISEYEAHGDAFASWRDANNNSHGRNASAIQKGVKYGYFVRTTFLGIPFYTWTEKSKVGDWNP
jgi:hypothetical protein